jgi:hypothetical protein
MFTVFPFYRREYEKFQKLIPAFLRKSAGLQAKLLSNLREKIGLGPPEGAEPSVAQLPFLMAKAGTAGRSVAMIVSTCFTSSGFVSTARQPSLNDQQVFKSA